MPPKKRTRANTKESQSNARSPVQKRSRGAASLPPKPLIDTYKPEEASEESLKKVRDVIQRTTTRLTKGKKGESSQLQMSISVTEGDLLLGKDGKSNIERLQESSRCKITVMDKVDRSNSREVTISGITQEKILAIMEISLFLTSIVNKYINIETEHHFTLLLPERSIKLIGLKQLKTILPDVDISSVFVPFSNYQTLYFHGRITQLIADLVILMEELSKTSTNFDHLIADLPPTLKVPITNGIRIASSETNQHLVEKSRAQLRKYLNQDHSREVQVQLKRDPREHTKQQISQAQQECSKQLKSFDQLKFTIEFPADLISRLNLNEIRSKSNSNVVVADSETVVDGSSYRQLRVTGLAEYNAIALRYLLGVLN